MLNLTSGMILAVVTVPSCVSALNAGALFCPLTQDTERFYCSDLCLDHCCQWSTTRRERLVLYSCGARRIVRSSMNSIRGRAHFELKAFACSYYKLRKSNVLTTTWDPQRYPVGNCLGLQITLSVSSGLQNLRKWRHVQRIVQTYV